MRSPNLQGLKPIAGLNARLVASRAAKKVAVVEA
jgi:hypothetical protein